LAKTFLTYNPAQGLSGAKLVIANRIMVNRIMVNRTRGLPPFGTL